MNYLGAFISILIAEGAGLIGSAFTMKNIPTWYATLAKPALNPPNWIFGPVWIALYALMGVSAYLVWQQKDLPGAKIALLVYGIQLALNIIWSILFFGLKNPGFAFAEIIILWIAIVVTIILFWRISPLPGALLLPYIAWVSFASYLNYSIWTLNY